MTENLLKGQVVPAEGEATVKAYHCTYYRSRLLGLKADGYLAITNKRVIFHAAGSSNAGSSVIQSEVPIEDVSGIASYKGTYFSLGRLLGAFIVSGVCAALLSTIFSLSIAALDSWDAARAFLWIAALGTLVGSFACARRSIWRSLIASAAFASWSLLGGTSVLGTLGGLMGFRRGGGWEFILALGAFIYVLICCFWYSRGPTFSLAINSSGGSSTPISISGAGSIGLFHATAGRALNAEPAGDAEAMLKELGAVILDIQTLGDLGISKWTQA